ncbi:MAG: DUF4215 domain-containing protein [Kofleriaceae bacterium]|nr:DUF4215 domain-containing protein [Kofleriaceae bacterium]
MTRCLQVGLVMAGLGVALATTAAPAHADTTPQPLPFFQDWTDTTQFTVDDDWSGVPGIVGHTGLNLVPNPGGADPAGVLADGADTPVMVRVGRTSPPSTLGIVQLVGGPVGTDPLVAIAGSNQFDAPHLVIFLDTRGSASVEVSYVLVDEGAISNEVDAQPVALQYRIGTSGPYTNVPEGYAADPTDRGRLGRRTPIRAMLPADAADREVVQVRILTANTQGLDDWVGIDNILVRAGHPPTATGRAEPVPVAAGAPLQLLATVVPGDGPPSTELDVGCDLTPLGGGPHRLFDDGAHGDGAAGDLVFGLAGDVPADQPEGPVDVMCRVRDAQARVQPFAIHVVVGPLCGNGVVDAGEACDDGACVDGDGCSATCQVEAGYECDDADGPSHCEDVDECTEELADCASGAACVNLPGSFACACPDGFEGDGHGGGTGCVDVDECALGTDDCADHARCDNVDGGFACACDPGFTGDGHAGGTGCVDIDECEAMLDDCSPYATCADTEGGYTCACLDGFFGDGMACWPVCGDGQLVADEQCDDGDTYAGDGCTDTCEQEPGWSCDGAPTVCVPICGDGVLVGDEACDDGDTFDGDGCTSTCELEPGWTCAGAPTTCRPICDDGVLVDDEVCDDADADHVVNGADNCPLIANPDQADADGDGVGDACEPPPPPDPGGCATAGGAPSPAALAGVLLLAAWLRRRRA